MNERPLSKMTESTVARDAWLLPILEELLPADAINAIEGAVTQSYWETAVSTGAITDERLLAIVSRRAHARIADDLFVNPDAIDIVPESLARRYRILPLDASASRLEIATANPYDADCERTLGFWSGRTVSMSLAPPLLIAERIEEAYGKSRRLNGWSLSRVPVTPDSPAWENSPEGSDDGPVHSGEPVVRLVDRIVAGGIAERASDIHLEPTEQGVAVRYRVDGLLRGVMVLPKSVGVPLVSRVKIMAGMDIADRLRPQGGHATVNVDGTRVDLRVSTLPASHGEKVVIRILDTRSAVRSLEGLGLDEIDAPRMRRLLEVREGLVLVTGPTGSGKTTTLYAALLEIQRRGVNVITVEDPVEYRIPGIVQVQINEKAGLTFASALRSILRQDPDVVLIGEIRDRETAAIAIQAALTGHLVFATLHTNDACSSITRLTDLGVDSAKLAGALKGIVAQRLIRRLCSDCRIVANAGVSPRLRVSVPADAMVYVPVGCAKCSMTGYRGRLAVTEIVIADTELERAVAANAPLETLTSACRREGTRSLWDSGVTRLLAGDTSGDELTRVLEQEVASSVEDDPRGTDIWALFDTPGRRTSLYDSADDLAALPARTVSVTAVVPGVVDIYVIRPLATGWRILAVQRALDTRCPGAWETVHGRIEGDERPEAAARREVKEETGLEIDRLYNVTVQPFYLHTLQTIQLAVVFAAFVAEPGEVTLGAEHQHHEWLSLEDAQQRFIWPRERQVLNEIKQLLGSGDAGPVEDVLRVY
jgi:type II secretory ATPase GspE/PulE/Tfp pilus assembly ATPase PilB-like protein/8-oxo-dGTP pyrophosphatase MutT (NUDIX family)